ncbi:hypothetical protein [Sphingomonas sp. PAMC 26605]|nr:hypothetical protein [Sphingomonas sp. PAMC 26605]
MADRHHEVRQIVASRRLVSARREEAERRQDVVAHARIDRMGDVGDA